VAREDDGVVWDDERRRVVALVHQGKRYPLRPLTEDDFERIEEYLQKQRKDPLSAIEDDFARAANNPRLQEMLVERAYRDLRKEKTVAKVTRQEVHDYLDTREGTIHSLWLMMKHHAPDLTLDHARVIFREASSAEGLKKLQEGRDRANVELIDRTLGRQDPQPQPQPEKKG
jgi:hypothetical protein